MSNSIEREKIDAFVQALAQEVEAILRRKETTGEDQNLPRPLEATQPQEQPAKPQRRKGVR